MAFYAQNFVFDGVPSETYGLIISSSGGGEESSNTSNDVNIKTQEIYRRPVPYFYGVSQVPVLEFEAEISTTTNELTAIDSAIVQKWLFGQIGYKKLRIVQYDMEDVYFNCFLKDPKVKRVGNIIRGYTFTVVCDSPFAWGNMKTTTYTQSNKNYIFFNESENLFYTFPSLTIRMNGTSGDFLLRNITDSNRDFSISGLLAGEVVTVDNDLQIVTASLSPNILSKFSSPIKFFRLLSGVNHLYVSGNVLSLSISYTPMKRAG